METNEKEAKKAEYDETSPLYQSQYPVDQGWAWVILIASFLNTVLAVGYYRSFGIFFVDLLKLLNVPASMASLILGMQGAAISIGGFITQSVLISVFSERTIVVSGGLLIGSGVMASAISPGIPSLIITQSIMVGIGLAMIMGPVIIILNKYFNKRRSLAVAISTTGANVGAIVFPPLVRYLLDEYGFRGTFLIVGAMMLNIMIFGLLLRPFNLYDSIPTNEIITPAVKGYQNVLVVDCDEKEAQKDKMDDTGSPSPQKQSPESCRTRDTSVSPPRQTIPPELLKSSCDSPPDLSVAACPVAWKKNYTLLGDAAKSEKQNSCWNCCSVFNFALFKNPLFLIVIASAVFGVHAATTMNTYIPALAKGKNVTKLRAALLLSLVGATGIVGRLMVGFFADLNIVKRSLLMSIALAVSGVAALCSPVYNGFETLIIFCLIYGFFGGLYFNLIPVVLVDFLGEEHLSTSFGFVQLFSGASMAAVNPVTGWLHDVTGNYDAAYQLLGMLSVTASAILLLEMFIIRLRH